MFSAESPNLLKLMMRSAVLGLARKISSRMHRRALDFFHRRVVGQAEIHFRLDRGAARDVGDDGVAHHFVRNRDVMSVEIANARAAQADGFHHAVHALDLDAVAKVKRLVQKNRHRAEQVRHRVLRRQAERQAADGKAGEQARDFDVEIVRRQHHRRDDDGRFGHFAQQREELFRKHLVLRRTRFFPATAPSSKSTNFSTT